MALWTPPKYAPKLWLQTRDAEAVDLSGSAIVALLDGSGNGHDMPAPTVAARPLYLEDEINGHAVASFNGSSHYLRNQFAQLLANNATGFTVFFVGTVPTASSRFAFLYGNDSRRQMCLQGFNGDHLVYAATDAATHLNVSSDLAFRAHGWVYDGTKTGNAERLRFFRDGAFVAGSYAGTVPANLGTIVHDTYLGVRSNLTAFIEMKFGELIVYPRALSAEQIDTVNGYIHHAWGIQSRLTEGHPWKSTPPALPAAYTGTVRDKNGVLAEREILLIRKSDKALLGPYMSDPVTGAFDIPVTEEPHKLIFSGEPSRNALIFDDVMPE